MARVIVSNVNNNQTTLDARMLIAGKELPTGAYCQESIKRLASYLIIGIPNPEWDGNEVAIIFQGKRRYHFQDSI